MINQTVMLNKAKVRPAKNQCSNKNKKAKMKKINQSRKLETKRN